MNLFLLHKTLYARYFLLNSVSNKNVIIIIIIIIIIVIYALILTLIVYGKMKFFLHYVSIQISEYFRLFSFIRPLVLTIFIAHRPNLLLTASHSILFVNLKHGSCTRLSPSRTVKHGI